MNNVLPEVSYDVDGLPTCGATYVCDKIVPSVCLAKVGHVSSLADVATMKCMTKSHRVHLTNGCFRI
jgi:hypothetical protein